MKVIKPLLITAAALVVVAALVIGLVVLWSNVNKEPLPIEDRCQATAAGKVAVIDPEQSRNAAIIAGGSIKRGLKPRAASIALATAFQESGVRNLNYGHADSIGLFQQRPSKGWGTEAQIMDPWYSTKSFYRAMERINHWDTKDINDVAQAVQRSAYPEAYRKHVDRARTLATALTGESPASYTCVVAHPQPANPTGMRTFLSKTLGDKVSFALADGVVTATVTRPQDAWAVAQLAVAVSGDYGLVTAKVGQSSWTRSTSDLAAWQFTPTDATEVVLIFTEPSPR